MEGITKTNSLSLAHAPIGEKLILQMQAYSMHQHISAKLYPDRLTYGRITAENKHVLTYNRRQPWL